MDGIKRLGPKLWHVRVKRIDQRTGKQTNRKATVEGCKADALRVRDELRGGLGATGAKRRRVQLAPYANDWLERRDLRDTTKRRYGYALLKILPVLGDFYIDQLRPPDVQNYINMRCKEAEGYTVLNELRTLRTIARDALAEGLIDRVFTDRVPAPKVRKYSMESPNLLTARQFRDTYAVLAKKWHGMTMLMFTTGLRWGEASALQWENLRTVDEEVIALIKHGNDRGALVDVKTDGSLRTVPVLAEVLKLLGLRKGKGPVFPSRSGNIYASSAPLLRALKLAEKKAGVPFEVTVHGLRRTFNNLARRKTSREVLMSLTGHDTDEMVEHYSVVDHSERNAASRAVFDLLEE